MTYPDTSVLVAGYNPHHPTHEVAKDALVRVRRGGGLIAHTVAEATSVLTGPGFMISPESVRTFLGQFVREAPVVGIDPRRYPGLIAELTTLGIVGGAIYDGLIAASARQAGATLVSLDRRAEPIYDAVGAEYEILI